MNRLFPKAAALVAALSITAAACGGSDATDTDTDAAEPTDQAVDEDASDDAGSDLVAVDVPDDWDASVPTDPIDGMTLTSATVRGDDARPIYELQYDGMGQDGAELFDDYKALVIAAGWTEGEQATPTVGSFAMGGRNLVITTFGGDNSQIIVSAVTI